MRALASSAHRHEERGFTLIDTMVVVAIVGIVAATAVPVAQSSLSTYRIKGDASNLYNTVTLAKMRAASRFTRARVYVNRTARTYRLEVWNKTTNAWDTEGGVETLSRGVSFGFGNLAAAPANTQTNIGMSSGCTDGTGDGGTGAVVDNTSCIVFNSRGVPISMVPATGIGSPVGDNAFYVTDGVVVYATTVTSTPLVRFWWTGANGANWMKQ